MKTNKLLISAVLAIAVGVPIAGFVGEMTRWHSQRHPREYESRSSTVSSTRKVPVKPS